MKFMLIIAHGDEFTPTQELVGAIHEWISENAHVGVRIHGNPLQPAATATTVRIRDGRQQVVAGPFSRSNEQMCAYELVECASMDAAVRLALTHPMAKAATIEVRPIWPELAVGQAVSSAV